MNSLVTISLTRCNYNFRHPGKSAQVSEETFIICGMSGCNKRSDRKSLPLLLMVKSSLTDFTPDKKRASFIRRVLISLLGTVPLRVTSPCLDATLIFNLLSSGSVAILLLKDFVMVRSSTGCSTFKPPDVTHPVTSVIMHVRSVTRIKSRQCRTEMVNFPSCRISAEVQDGLQYF